ncbi:MAG: tRNA pseudouridine(55) synthase TruB [Candidatus Fimisoma sp.]|nr:tRNA pseudouridine(55) synthase TruB [Bacillota bacterium]MDY4747878.1 tRNA pseudouridine(55) synthase TruB [Candidatus Fimisoma sp.]
MIENGILNINKPAGMTSHDVVAIVRRVTGIRRVGHTGTLDPMAQGVLPVCIGTAARITEYLDMDFKTYRCTMLLGKITDTQDIWGETIEERPVTDISSSDIERALAGFKGYIDQTPPMYSAVKVRGKKLYEYARAGEEVKVKSRRIYIKNLEAEEINMDKNTVRFTVTCSKGTYVRTLCHDAGNILGCGACLASLERTASGRFTIEDSVPMDRIREMTTEEIEGLLLPTDFPLTHFGEAVVNRETGRQFADGHHLPLNRCVVTREPEYGDVEPEISIRPEYRKAYNIYQKTSSGKIFLGVAFYSDKYRKLVADKVFSRGDSNESV